MNPLPRLDLLSGLLREGDYLLASQSSTQVVSQLTPLGSQQTASSGKLRSHFSINLPESSHSAGTYRLPSDLGHYTPTMTKHNQGMEAATDSHPFADEDNIFGGLNFDIDSNGNILGIIDNQAELPPLSNTAEHDAQVFQEQLLLAGEDASHFPHPGHGLDVHVLGEQPLPDADPFPRIMAQKKSSSSLTPIATSETEQIVVPVKRRRRPKKQVNMLDQRTSYSAKEIRLLDANYVANMDVQRNRARTTTLTQARKNASALSYGNGIASVGAPQVMGIDGLTHPLAEHFSGNTLQSQLLGRVLQDMQVSRPTVKGRRRRRAEAFAED